MSINLEKINYELICRLRNLAESSFDNGDYLGALLLNFLFLEGTVTHVIAFKLAGKPNIDESTFNKFKKGAPSSAILIDYFYLLTNDLESCKKLRNINKKRNTIIHAIFEYETYDKILQEARTLTQEIKEIDKHLLNTYWPKATETDTKKKSKKDAKV